MFQTKQDRKCFQFSRDFEIHKDSQKYTNSKNYMNSQKFVNSWKNVNSQKNFKTLGPRVCAARGQKCLIFQIEMFGMCFEQLFTCNIFCCKCIRVTKHGNKYEK